MKLKKNIVFLKVSSCFYFPRNLYGTLNPEFSKPTLTLANSHKRDHQHFHIYPANLNKKTILHD